MSSDRGVYTDVLLRAYRALVNPLVYPVPHVSDHFTIRIESGVTTTIKYELLDATLVALHSVTYLVRAGHDEEHPVTSDTGIPSGICFHKFTYSDGSFDLIPAVR